MSGFKNCGTFTQWNTTQQEEGENSYLCDNMDGTGDYHAKWNKLVGGRRMPYDLIHRGI